MSKVCVLLSFFFCFTSPLLAMKGANVLPPRFPHPSQPLSVVPAPFRLKGEFFKNISDQRAIEHIKKGYGDYFLNRCLFYHEPIWRWPMPGGDLYTAFTPTAQEPPELLRPVFIANLTRQARDNRQTLVMKAINRWDFLLLKWIFTYYSEELRKSSINLQDVWGQTALHYAMYAAATCDQAVEVAAILLNLGADTSIHDIYERTPIDIVRSRWNESLKNKFIGMGQGKLPIPQT